MPTTEPRRARTWALLLGAALLSVGCASSTELEVSVTSQGDTNGGRPFYAVIRSVDQATHFTDTYDSIAQKVFANPADPSVLGAEVIYPGVDTKLTVKRPEGLPVGLYFLFTAPGDHWKVLKAQPLPSTVEVELGKSDVVSIE